MKKILVYDLPTRFFHWIFAGLFVAAFFIAKTFDDDSAIYPYHMILGLVLAFTVLLRIIWGFVGTRYARFTGFDLNPLRLLNYFKQTLTGKTERQLGHNPASSWVALLMMALALGSAVTGYLMAQGDKETYEDIHELFANTFLIAVIAHVAGVIFHTIRHRDPIGLSMITGTKAPVEGQEGIKSRHLFAGVVFLVLSAGFSLTLLKNYDPAAGTLKFFGTTLELSESESESGEGGKEASGAKHEEDEDGDDD